MFLSRNKKNKVYPCKPQFYDIKVGFKGVRIFVMIAHFKAGFSSKKAVRKSKLLQSPECIYVRRTNHLTLYLPICRNWLATVMGLTPSLELPSVTTQAIFLLYLGPLIWPSWNWILAWFSAKPVAVDGPESQRNNKSHIVLGQKKRNYKQCRSRFETK